jgi:DNA-binding NarL/FixJ family response regulator
MSARLEDLTIREKQIIVLVYQAKANKEIAYDLGVAEGTIKECLNRIFRKVDVTNRTGLALWAYACLRSDAELPPEVATAKTRSAS